MDACESTPGSSVCRGQTPIVRGMVLISVTHALPYGSGTGLFKKCL